MDEEIQDKINAQLIRLRAETATRGVDWNGYEVYVPDIDVSKVGFYIGPPWVILVKGNEVRRSDADESWEYLRYESKVKRMQNKLKHRRKKQIEDIYNSD